jgi:hypothetical protein
MPLSINSFAYAEHTMRNTTAMGEAILTTGSKATRGSQTSAGITPQTNSTAPKTWAAEAICHISKRQGINFMTWSKGSTGDSDEKKYRDSPTLYSALLRSTI